MKCLNISPIFQWDESSIHDMFSFPATSVPLSWWKAWILSPCSSALWMTGGSCTSLPRMGLFVRWTWSSHFSYFRPFTISSMFLTTQLYCYIKFFLWNLRFCIVKKLIGSRRNLRCVSYLHRGDSGISENEQSPSESGYKDERVPRTDPGGGLYLWSLCKKRKGEELWDGMVRKIENEEKAEKVQEGSGKICRVSSWMCIS